MSDTIKCPLCGGEFVGQTGHACTGSKAKIVVVHPNGPKQPGQDAQAHADLAVRNLELLLEVEELRNRRAPSPAVRALVEACKGLVPTLRSGDWGNQDETADEIDKALAAVEREIGNA